MSIQHALLGLLANGPLHGYDLKTAYEGELVPGARLNVGQVYKSLERLGRDGMVTHALVRQDVRPDKKVYEITRAGRQELDRWLERPIDTAIDRRDETFLKLVISRRLRGSDPLRVIRSERRACMARLHEIIAAKSEVEPGKRPAIAPGPSSEAAVSTAMLLDLSALRLEANLKWLDNCERRLRSGS